MISSNEGTKPTHTVDNDSVLENTDVLQGTCVHLVKQIYHKLHLVCT